MEADAMQMQRDGLTYVSGSRLRLKSLKIAGKGSGVKLTFQDGSACELQFGDNSFIGGYVASVQKGEISEREFTPDEAGTLERSVNAMLRRRGQVQVEYWQMDTGKDSVQNLVEIIPPAVWGIGLAKSVQLGFEQRIKPLLTVTTSGLSRINYLAGRQF